MDIQKQQTKESKDRLKYSNKAHHNRYVELQEKITNFVGTKLGYPESMLSSLYGDYIENNMEIGKHCPQKLIDNTILGIIPNSLAELLILNVGSPWKESDSFLMEVKDIEKEVIQILARYFGMDVGNARGYVTSGGTEANLSCLWWCSRLVINDNVANISSIKLQRDEMLAILKSYDKQHKDYLKVQLNYYKLELKLSNSLKPVVFASSHTHYSINKLCGLLSLDINIIDTTAEGQISFSPLIQELKNHVYNHPYRGIIIVVNVGTTVTGANDDIKKIKRILDEITENGSITKYAIHCDGALGAITMPITEIFGSINDYFTELGINTLSISGHKFLGTAVCGVALTTKSFLEKAFANSNNNIEYCGNIDDITITGCRSGLNVLWLHNTLMTLKLNEHNDIIKNLVETNLQNAEYFYHELGKIIGYQNVLWIPKQFNIVFDRPSKELISKYKLMPALSNKAVVCVLTNVTISLIDQFIKDYKNDWYNGPRKLGC